MSKFEHMMTALEVDAKSPKPFKFDMIAGMVEIKFLPAVEGNGDYADASLLLSQKNGKDPNRRGKTNIKKEMQRARREDMALFAKYCAKGWTGVVDIKGGEVAFSVKDCFEFLVALPVRYQDSLRGWIRTSTNFLPEVEKPEDETGEFDVSDLDEFDLDDLDAAIKSERKGDDEGDLGKHSEKSSPGKGDTPETKGKSREV